MKMHAFSGDVLGFYQDNLARESRLSTATQRSNVIALARMMASGFTAPNLFRGSPVRSRLSPRSRGIA
ncbi:hypothetical protein [Myxococcus xanthus]|uniref:hypothetical protein n=1 Tax=Myxococcus xanthus TaxID=34 RepID=UPI0020A5A96C|nr:hypothetical protein [Myxococcus xanthus]